MVRRDKRFAKVIQGLILIAEENPLKAAGLVKV